jgi:PhzF family phenazine biosynthesis protein
MARLSQPHTLRVVRTIAFAEGAIGGHACPVVLDGDVLDPGYMQVAAQRFGVETVFVLESRAANADIRLRYFVPTTELEMCVHGTAAALAVLIDEGLLDRPSINVETPLGPILATCARSGRDYRVRVAQFPPYFGPAMGVRSEVASAMRVTEDKIGGALGPIRAVSTSRSKLIVPVADTATLHSLRPDVEALWRLCETLGAKGLYAFAACLGEALLDVEARHFPLRSGYDEDPATGVAACALGAYLARHEVLGPAYDGWHDFRVGQGRGLGHPCVMEVHCRLHAGAIVETGVSGSVVVVGEESLTL